MTELAQLILKHHKIELPKEFPGFDKAIKTFLQYVKLEKGFSIFLDRVVNLEKFSHVTNIPTFLGIEAEVEGTKSIPLPKFWKTKPDGSLRQGVEFFSAPLTPRQAMVATTLLFFLMRKMCRTHKPIFSWRTSNHVHLNVLNLNEEEFRKLMILCVLLEPVLFAFAGEAREQSVYCVPLYQSRLDALGKYLRKDKRLRALATEWPKYTATNLCRMYEYTTSGPAQPALGTVEFRHLGGTDSLDRVLTWESMILQIFQAAVAIPSVDHLLNSVDGLTTPAKYRQFAGSIISPSILIPLVFSEKSMDAVGKLKSIFVEPSKGTFTATSALGVYSLRALKEYQKKSTGKAIKEPSLATPENVWATGSTLQSLSNALASFSTDEAV